jgi:hypothetical protein
LPCTTRALIENRYGELGAGVMFLEIGGRNYALLELMTVLGLDFEDVTPNDAHNLSGEQHAVRYYDAEDRCIVAYEFDADFHYPRVPRSRCRVAGQRRL